MPSSLTLRLSTTNLVAAALALLGVVVLYRSFSGSVETHLHDVADFMKAKVPVVKSFPQHSRRIDGLLEVNMTGRHPLLDLMDEAERRWEEMNASQSKTLDAAVAEYVRRNGYAPPAGFDLWWDFTQKHNVKLVDEFDQINYDITPYLALSPKTFRERVNAASDPHKGFHVNVTNGHVSVYGPRWWLGEELQFGSMVGSFSRALPDLAMHGHEQLRGDSWIGEDLRKEAAAKARAGEYFTEDDLRHFESHERNSYHDIKNVCQSDDPIFDMTRPSGAPTFIASHLTYMSPCISPSILRTPPLLFAPHARQLELIPQFVFSKNRPGSGFLLPTETWEFHDPLLVTPHTWAERQERDGHKLFWRGVANDWHWSKGMASRESGITWRDGSRTKLALSFSDKLAAGQIVEVLMENDGPEGGLITKPYDRAWLNERWMDIGLTGSPVMCNREDGTCDEMQRAAMWKAAYPGQHENSRKFSVDLDSENWSSEFQRKLSWGHVVLKSTTYPEWNTQWLIPYYHYIPIQSDYSDVYNIMAFFLGDPETGAGDREDLAEKISRRASEYARNYWRWEDMQAYLYRLVLEYARLLSEDRRAASFRQ